jgi:hypothetical protein
VNLWRLNYRGKPTMLRRSAGITRQLTHSRRKRMSAGNRTAEHPVMWKTESVGGCWVERLVRLHTVCTSLELTWSFACSSSQALAFSVA